MMTKLWLYAYAVGTKSSRKVARLAQRDVGFMMLAAGNQPDFRTLNEFRSATWTAFEGPVRASAEAVRAQEGSGRQGDTLRSTERR